jgi:hemolysin III
MDIVVKPLWLDAPSPKSTPKPVWVSAGFGKARCDDKGVPLYEPWEMRLDGAVHLAGILWAISSVVALLCASRNTVFVVYSLGHLLIFCTSACYNVLGCAYRIATEGLRRLDQASIFIAFACYYTVFIRDQRLLLGTWLFSGTGAALKVLAGRRFENVAFLCYGVLLSAPLVALRPHMRAYPPVAGCVATIFFGVIFGYMNNNKGGTVIWHLSVLAASITFWTAVYGAAKHGVQSYL